jgi:hypothetical protein
MDCPLPIQPSERASPRPWADGCVQGVRPSAAGAGRPFAP